MRIYAFQGLRFAGDDPGRRAAPPFDQINPALQESLHGTSEHHFSHLTRPAAPEGASPYEHSATLHRRWLEEGAVTRDEAPSLYPYTIEVADGSRRIGICALVGVEPVDSGVIRPHEQTLDKPFEDRLNLLRATRVDYEPVMFLADDDGALETLLEEDLAGASPVAEHRDADDNLHRLYRVSEPARLDLYRSALADRSAAIADGHHRYKVGRTFAEEMAAAPGTATGSKMAVLLSLASPHVVIDPIHRGLTDAHDLEPLRDLVRECRPLDAADGSEVARAVARADAEEGPALGLYTTGGRAEIWLLDPERMPPGQPPGAEDLAVCQLHRVLLPQLGLSDANYLDGTVTYRSDPSALFEEVAAGDLVLGLWLPPMSGAAFGKAISKGDLLPAKATRFLPKLASGLVWSGHDGTLA